MSARPRVLSGMRPTGRVHLGNFLGALDNWVRLQAEFECFYFVADWHAFTTDIPGKGEIAANTLEMAADWLGAGLDPERSTIFVQSLVPEHAELHLIFSMVTPVSWLERVPTYKEMVEQLGMQSPSYGLLGYPLLQAADILIYRPRHVPVGVDQPPHIELTREGARRFSQLFGPVLLEPDIKLTSIPKAPGTDGRKMSKSYDNAIYLADRTEVTVPKIKTMVTDPARKRRSDPGNPDVCPVFDLYRIFSPEPERARLAQGRRTAGIGCLDCKGVLLEHMVPPLQAIRERRDHMAARPDHLQELLREGSARARRVASETLAEVKAAVGVA
jgi:tryptophanyl-tRNA synthetase